MRRRDWLAAAAAAALAFPGRRVRAAGPEPAPTSVDQALEQIETLMSPEALAAFYAASEDDVRELRMGLLHIYLSRGWEARGRGGYIPSLAADLRARQVPDSDEGYHYLLTVLWRRKHGMPLDTPAVSKSIEHQERTYSDRISHWEEATSARVIDDREHFLWMPVVYFDEGSVRPRPDGDAVDYIAKEMQKPTSVCALAQVQGHASPNESAAHALSLGRARAIVARLVRRGVDPARLAAHGLGTRFPARPPTICPAGVPLNEKPSDCISPRAAGARAPARDRRVEVFCLRRHWVPPLPNPPAVRKQP